MEVNKQTHYRGRYRIASARHPNFDYTSPGYYFVTINIKHRKHFFGSIKDGEMILSPAGLIAANEWEKTYELRPYVIPDAWVIMPDHVHMIVRIVERRADRDGGDGRDDIACDVGSISCKDEAAPRLYHGCQRSDDIQTSYPHIPNVDNPYPSKNDGSVIHLGDHGMRMETCDGIACDVGSISCKDEATPRLYHGRQRSDIIHTSSPIPKSNISPKPASLSSIIGSYKSACTRRIRNEQIGTFVWQPRFHDKIIRDERTLSHIRHYIQNNPKKWNG